MLPNLIFLGLFAQSVFADEIRTTQPFLLKPDGVGFLGWLSPNQCQKERRCDIIIVDPLTGQLYVEQSDDAIGTRVYSSRAWELSQRIPYESHEGLVDKTEDAWGMEVTYAYDDRDLIEINWSDGRVVQIAYDRKGRVVSLADSDNHLLSFSWGKDRNRMVDSQGHLVEWWLDKGRITTRNSLGVEASLLIKDSEVVGWIDPRGIETRLISEEGGFQIDQGGLRTWQIQHNQSRPTQITLSGSGSWRWVRDDDGQIKELIDPTGNTVKILRNNRLIWRLQRSNGFIDLQFSKEEDLEEIRDVSGRLMFIKRDVLGRIIRIEDAVGEMFSIRRDRAGAVTKLVMRDGAEWNLEWDDSGWLRSIVTPKQEVWGFQRDVWGSITKIERSHWPTIDIRRDQFQRWTKISQDSRVITASRDMYGRLIAMNIDEQQDMTIQRDTLGQITKIKLNDAEWILKRDTFGNVVRWNNITITRGVWDSIVQHSIDDHVWQWGRDGQARLQNIVSEEQLDIQYDGLGFPVEWTLGDEYNKIQRNHWGWVTAFDDTWVDRDPRGLVSKVGVLDQEWRFNRDAAGRILVVKAPYELQLGFSRSTGGEVEQCRLPSGALQHFEWQTNQMNQAYTNDEGQRYPIGSNTKISSWLLPYTKTIQNPMVSSNYVGVHTIQHFENVDIVDYDPFHFVQQVCDLSSCFHFDYDARGRIRSVDDGSGLPINIVWGWSGWNEAPLLIGGTLGIHSELGMLVQTNGHQHQEYPIWEDQPISLGWAPDDEFADSARWINEQLYLGGVTASWSGKQTFLDTLDRAVQTEYPWQSNTFEAELFSMVAESSFWNRPLELLWSMGVIDTMDWKLPQSESPLPWVDQSWLSDGNILNMSVAALPIKESALEELLMSTLLSGHPDPSIEEILSILLVDEDVGFLVDQSSLLSVLK